MTKPIENNTCCLCGLPYERIGNNPYPLAMVGRCCDACDGVVVQARLGVLKMADVERVRAAMARKLAELGDELRTPLGEVAIAAICALRGPGLLVEKQSYLKKLRELKDKVWDQRSTRALKEL